MPGLRSSSQHQQCNPGQPRERTEDYVREICSTSSPPTPLHQLRIPSTILSPPPAFPALQQQQHTEEFWCTTMDGATRTTSSSSSERASSRLIKRGTTLWASRYFGIEPTREHSRPSLAGKTSAQHVRLGSALTERKNEERECVCECVCVCVSVCVCVCE